MRTTRSEPRIRFNWGFWDGRHDARRGRFPTWARAQRARHPDPVYGAGYWAGWCATEDPADGTSDAAWQQYCETRA